MGWLLQNFPICINKLAPGVLLSGTGPRKRTSFRSSLVLNYSVRWMNVHRPDPRLEGGVFPVSPGRATRFRQQSGFGIRASLSPGIPRQFPWQIHATPFVSWIKFTLFFRPYSTTPSAPTSSSASFDGDWTKEGRFKREELISAPYFLPIFLSSSFFFWINLAKVRTSYLSLIVENETSLLRFFPSPFSILFSRTIIKHAKRIIHTMPDAFQTNQVQKLAINSPLLASETVETQRLFLPWDGQKKPRDQRSRDGKIISLQTVLSWSLTH